MIKHRIDTNHHRKFHKEALDQRRQENNSRVKEPVTPLEYEFTSDELSDNKVEMRRDQMLANKDPQKYCADRCVSTGHCDVFEDLFDFSAEEVMAFCTDCVLSEDDEVCILCNMCDSVSVCINIVDFVFAHLFKCLLCL